MSYRKQLFHVQEFDRLLEKDAEPNATYLCWGARPKKSESNRVLITPSELAPDSLCNCSQLGMELLQDKGCCACGNGSAPIRKSDEEGIADIKCYACFGVGCNNHSCRTDEEIKKGTAGCLFGYRGTLCSSCSPDFRSVGFSQCEPCQQHELHVRAGGWAMAFVIALSLLSGAFWYYVWKAQGETTPTERGERFTELLEQMLLLLNYCQLFLVISSTQRSPRAMNWQMQKASVEGNRFKFQQQQEQFHQDVLAQGIYERLAALAEMNVGLVLDFFSVQCAAGYEKGRNLEVLTTAFFLPALFISALLLGWYQQGSPFYGLKFGIVATSILFVGAAQVTTGNLFWCEMESATGWSLDQHAFLHPRPFVHCDGSNDEIRIRLYVALVANVIAIPGCFILLGSYVTNKMRGLQCLATALNPTVQCSSEADESSVTLHFFSAPLVAEMLGSMEDPLRKHASLPEKALLIQAASYATLMSEATGSKRLEAWGSLATWL